MRERLRVEMRMHMKTERERDKLRKKQRAEQVCERLEQRGTEALLCYAGGDKVKEKMKMYSPADAINQE